MRLFKRPINPIFVEEEQYNWRQKRGGGMRLLAFVLVISVTAVGIAMLIT